MDVVHGKFGNFVNQGIHFKSVVSTKREYISKILNGPEEEELLVLEFENSKRLGSGHGTNETTDIE